jgi:hypothetical protein
LGAARGNRKDRHLDIKRWISAARLADITDFNTADTRANQFRVVIAGQNDLKTLAEKP